MQVSTLLEILVEVQFPGPVGDAIFVSTLLEILGRGADAGLRLPPDVSTLLEILETCDYLRTAFPDQFVSTLLEILDNNALRKPGT